MTTLDRHDDVFVLNIGDTENRFHPTWVSEITSALDDVAEATGPRALVTTATGKFFSNGLDLEWLGEHQEQKDEYLIAVERLFARALSLPVFSVAAIQGHAFAAGAMLSLSHDVRVMRADRGFWCLPETDIDMTFTVGMASLVQSRLTPQTAHAAMLAALRYGGHEALSAGIVDHAVAQDAVLDTAVDIAAQHAPKAGETLATTKERMYAPTLAKLRHAGASS